MWKCKFWILKICGYLNFCVLNNVGIQKCRYKTCKFSWETKLLTKFVGTQKFVDTQHVSNVKFVGSQKLCE